jgi:hypothetical protein
MACAEGASRGSAGTGRLRALALALAGLGALTAGEPSIAVFSEPLFPSFAGVQGLMPDEVRQALAAAGLPARLVDAAELADPGRFSSRNCAVLVHLYGNTFPLAAVESLRAYRQAGGGVISFGVPFCHPCIEKGVAGWSTTGEEADLVTRTARGRNGTPGVLLRRVGTGEGIWVGLWSAKARAGPGTRWTVGAWVQSHGQFGDADRLYARFWDRTGRFLGQTGPAMPPEARDWTALGAEVTTPPQTHAIDLCLALFRPGEVTCDDLGLAPADSPTANRLRDPGFDRLPAQQWHDTGHVGEYLGHNGLGMGSFHIVNTNGQLAYRPPRGDPLGLAEVRYPALAPAPQAVIDEASFPATDRLLPVIASLGPDGDPAGYGTVLIEHGCAEFAGAIDVWAGYPAPPPRQALQVILHACAYALQKKGLLEAAVAESAHQAARDLPAESGRRVYPERPAMARGALLPKSPAPADRIVVTSPLGLSWEEQILLRALQGLVNRRQPEVYLADAWTEAVSAGREVETMDDPLTLIDRYRESAAGAVVYDPAFPPGINVAVSLAGARDLLPCTAELAQRFGLPIREDLRGRWTDLADAYEWATEQVLPACSREVVCHIKQGEPLTLTAAEMSASMADYLVAHRVFSFHLNRAFSQRERQVVERILAAYPALTPVIGYFGPEPGGAPNLTNEWDCVEITSRLGRPFIFTVNGNLSFHSGLPSIRGRQTTREPPRLDRSKAYVCFYLSDGDSPSTWYNTACRWTDKARGTVPIGWSFPVAALDVCPLPAERFLREATPLDELVMACSGIGYCYPGFFGTQVENGDRLLGSFLAETSRAIERSAMPILHVHHHGGTTDATLRRFAAETPGIRAVFADYGRTRTGYAESHFAAGGVPVLHCLTTGGSLAVREGRLADEMLAQIVAVAPTQRPAFILAFGIYWFMGPDQVKSIVDRLPADIVAVRPGELADLYREALRP